MDIKNKYLELKKEKPNLDYEMVQVFIKDMPEEANVLFDKMLYGCHIVDEDMYNKAVSLLHWVDNKGSGAKWTVTDIVRLSDIDFDNKDYYEYDYAYVVNMLYSDYCNVFIEPSYYLKMAKNYLEDNDYMGKPDERAYKNAKKRINYFK
ncbi:MAG: hypothetical protein MJ211_10155 [Bacteroidales bacterium]|nr:hypothetical protein [Bacteroidales bacterium]